MKLLLILLSTLFFMSACSTRIELTPTKIEPRENFISPKKFYIANFFDKRGTSEEKKLGLLNSRRLSNLDLVYLNESPIAFIRSQVSSAFSVHSVLSENSDSSDYRLEFSLIRFIVTNYDLNSGTDTRADLEFEVIVKNKANKLVNRFIACGSASSAFGLGKDYFNTDKSRDYAKKLNRIAELAVEQALNDLIVKLTKI